MLASNLVDGDSFAAYAERTRKMDALTVEEVNAALRKHLQPKKLIIVEQATQFAAANPIPVWLEVNYENLSGRVLSLPKRKDVALPINEQLIVELYSK